MGDLSADNEAQKALADAAFVVPNCISHGD